MEEPTKGNIYKVSGTGVNKLTAASLPPANQEEKDVKLSRQCSCATQKVSFKEKSKFKTSHL